MSLNDPQWGKRGRTGPPDLDEIWRNLVRRFNELFGRKEPTEPGDEVAPPRRQLPMGSAGLLVALVLVVWLVSGSYIVDEGRRGVVTRFGKYTETTTPGLRWHLPLPDRIRRRHRFLAGEDGRDRLSQWQSQEQDRQRIADAHRRREHHRYPVCGPIQPQECAGLRVQRA
jgi:hypothetical protein